ncbi:hypothetical protein V8E36_003845 [Tilletia maclaganii]
MSLKSGISLANLVKNSPTLSRFLTPVASAYANATGHRQHGLKYDDLVIEEDEGVQKALNRLTERESYDRAYRLRRAIQLSLLHRELPKEQWLSATEDQRYLTPLVEEVRKEDAEREAWDTIKLEKKH